MLNLEEINNYINALLSKSEEAYLMSIEIINKPTINYRTEGFCFFICNAWELLLKAYLIDKSKNINVINYKDNSNRTIGLDECVERVFTSTTDKTKINISFIRGIRNKSTHLILPEFDFVLAPAFQRCLTNYNRFFKKQFPNYNLNKKITPYIALVNPGDNQDVSSLILNPANLMLFDKLKNELDADENLVQTLKLVSTKKELDADLKYTIVKEGGENAKIINVPKDIDKTHPYKTKEIIDKISETVELTLGPNHGFTSNKFHNICKRRNIKTNQDYCYQFKYYTTNINMYSDLAIEYISQVYIDENKK